MNAELAKPIPWYLVYSGAGLIRIKNLLRCKMIRRMPPRGGGL
jgi:hypothetical protein